MVLAERGTKDEPQAHCRFSLFAAPEQPPVWRRQTSASAPGLGQGPGDGELPREGSPEVCEGVPVSACPEAKLRLCEQDAANPG